VKLVKLTTPDGKPVWVNPEMVCSVQFSVDGARDANTFIGLANGQVYVREMPSKVAVELVLP